MKSNTANPYLSPLALGMLTTGGLGYLRPASGTWGSIPPVLLAALVLTIEGGPGSGPNDLSFWIYNGSLGIVLVLFSLACILWGDAAELLWLKKDPGQVVADETAGMCIVLMLLPPATCRNFGSAVFALALCFFVFRILDILKPPPANQLQRIKGGLGILIDDLVVAGMGLVLVQLLLRGLISVRLLG